MSARGCGRARAVLGRMRAHGCGEPRRTMGCAATGSSRRCGATN